MTETTGKAKRRATVLLLVAAVYVVAHLSLSRFSARLVTRDWGYDGAFIYLPLRPDVVADHEMPLLLIHNALRYVFYPVWWIDHAFGGPLPMTSMPLRRIDALFVRATMG